MKKKHFEHLEDSCGDVSIDALRDYGIDTDKQRSLIAKEYDVNTEHPSPEQLLIREAVKYLTVKQKEAWEMYTYDRLTEDEIAKKLHISRDSVHDRLQGVEKKLIKWVKNNMGTYKLLKRDTSNE